MSKFLTTNGIAYHIEKMMIEAEEELILVTPYLKLTKIFAQRLLDVDKRSVEITLIYGKTEFDNKQKAFINRLKNLNLLYCHNLHAKSYMNEKEMVITSMNLHEYSEKNNREFGIRCVEGDELFDDTSKEINSIVRSSIIKKKSQTTEKYGFSSSVLKTGNPIFREFADYLNELYKKELFRVDEYQTFDGFSEQVVSKNIINGIDIVINNCLTFTLNYSKSDTEALFKLMGIEYLEKELKDYRVYWNEPYSQIKIYKSIFHRDNWANMSKDNQFEYYKKVIDKLGLLLKSKIEMKKMKPMTI